VAEPAAGGGDPTAGVEFASRLRQLAPGSGLGIAAVARRWRDRAWVRPCGCFHRLASFWLRLGIGLALVSSRSAIRLGSIPLAQADRG